MGVVHTDRTLTPWVQAGPPQKGCVEKRMKGQEEEPPKQGLLSLLFFLLHPFPLFLVQVIVILITYSLVTLSLVLSHLLPPGQPPDTLPSALSPWLIVFTCDALSHDALCLCSTAHSTSLLPPAQGSQWCPQHGGLLAVVQTRGHCD